MVDKRTEYIQFGLSNNIPIEGIDAALKESGFSPLNKSEYIQLREGTFGKSGFEKARKELSDIGGGLATIGGMLGQAIIKPDTVGKELVGNIKDYVLDKGTSGALVDFANAMLSPYNDLSLQKALTQPITETATDIGAGITAHPLNAGLDALGIGASSVSALGKTATGAKLIKKGIEAVDKVPLPKQVKSMIPGTREAKINDIINSAKQAPAYTIEQLDNLNNRIKTAKPEDISQAIKNLEEGTVTGTKEQLELTKTLKDLSKNIDNTLLEAGFNPGEARRNSYSQFITRKLQKEGKDIPVAEINKYLDDNNYVIKDIDKSLLDNLQLEAKDLFDKGLIYPVRHKTTATMAREGLLDEATKRTAGKNAKIYGTQSYDDLAKGLKESGYDSVINKFDKAEQVKGAINEINNTLGRKVDDLANLALKEDEVVVSPRLLGEKFNTSIVQGTDISNDIKSLSRGLNKAEMERYADDLYIISKGDLKALENAYASSKASTGVEKFTQMAKRSALATPRYLAGNLETNIGMNLTEGVTPLHYLKAHENMDLIPKALKRSTTFSGYLGKESRVDTKLADIYNQLFDRLKNGNGGEKLEAIQQITTTPVFKAAGNVELLDRSANYMYQAERYARETNRTIEEVLKAALKNNGNNETYRLLLNRVNNTLGDYAGRNYYLPAMANEIGQAFTPFYRPFTQGARQFLGQAVTHPIRNQLFNRIPSRYGNQISQYAEENLNVTPSDTYGGGFPVLPGYGYNPSRVIVNPFHAYSALGELATNPGEALGGNAMPFAALFGLMGKNRYGSEPRIPGQVTINGQKVQLDNNGNVVRNDSLLTKLQLAGAQSAQAYFAPVNQMNAFVLPLLAAMTNQEYRRPYDTSIFGTVGEFRIPGVMDSDPTSRAKVREENILPLLGFNYQDTYPERRYNMRDFAKAFRLMDRRKQRNNRR